jgi:hypothetical protein
MGCSVVMLDSGMEAGHYAPGAVLNDSANSELIIRCALGQLRHMPYGSYGTAWAPLKSSASVPPPREKELSVKV